MPERKSFPPHLWLSLPLVLAAFLLLAPIRSSGATDSSPGLDPAGGHSFRQAALPEADLRATSENDEIPRADVYSSEDEEQDEAVVFVARRGSFRLLCTFRGALDRQWLAPLPILSLYPLRC